MADRPFTDPSHVASDRLHVAHMIRRLWRTCEEHPELKRTRFPFRRVYQEDGRRPHQVILTRPDDLRTRDEFIVIGFFGHMREGAERVTLIAVQQVDEELIGDFPRFGGLLSYSSMLLENGDWGNVATFKDMDSMIRWANNRRHTTAVRLLAARHYANIRLHTLAIRRGGLNANHLEPVRTKFYEYGSDGEWRGLREWAAEQTPASQAADVSPRESTMGTDGTSGTCPFGFGAPSEPL